MAVRNKGRSLELFFVDGRPDGMLVAKEFNWTGQVLVTSRTELGEALKRKDAGYTGVYLLFGEKDEKPLGYIGEADNVGDRIRSHEINKDWWTFAILITAADNKLNKAHVRYLEARLIRLARMINKMTLENGTNPPIPGLTEAERANMEAFLDYLLMVLPAVRINWFVDDARPETVPQDEQISETAKPGSPIVQAPSPLFELQGSKPGMYATARQADGKFVVEKGSAAAMEWHQKGSYPSYRQLFEELVQMGILEKKEDYRVFSKSYAFGSASAAASVIKGRPWSGPNAWRIRGEQKSLKDWETEIAGSVS